MYIAEACFDHDHNSDAKTAVLSSAALALNVLVSTSINQIADCCSDAHGSSLLRPIITSILCLLYINVHCPIIQ